MAYGVEGVVLRGKKLVPDRIDIKIDASVHLKKNVPATTNIMLNIRDIGVQVDQARFWYERYAFPKVSDSGNISLTIDGMNVKLEITNTPNDIRRVFKLNNAAECSVDSINYTITDAKHETAYKLLQPILTSVLKAQIKHAVEDNLTSFLQMLDRELIKRRDVLSKLSKETSKVVEKAKEGAKEIGEEAGEMMDKAKKEVNKIGEEAGQAMNKAKKEVNKMGREGKELEEPNPPKRQAHESDKLGEFGQGATPMDIEPGHKTFNLDSGIDTTPITGYGKVREPGATTSTTSKPKAFDVGMEQQRKQQ